MACPGTLNGTLALFYKRVQLSTLEANVSQESTYSLAHTQGLFARRRMLLLTTGPHLYYVDPATMVLKGEIPWSPELRPEPKNFKTFFVHTVSVLLLLPPFWAGQPQFTHVPLYRPGSNLWRQLQFVLLPKIFYRFQMGHNFWGGEYGLHVRRQEDLA